VQVNKETNEKSDEENDPQTTTSNSNNINNTNIQASARKGEHQNLISEVAQVGDSVKSGRILCYQNKAPAAPESHTNPLKVVYSLKTPISTKSGSRYISTTSERILDAPDFINDYCKLFFLI